MSVNQSRAEKNESPQYRKTGRSGSSSLQRNFSGGSGKGGGGGTAPPPSYHSNISSLSSNRSFKKSSDAQGGQSRVSSGNVSSDSNNAAAANSARAGQNGTHLQPTLHGTSDAPAIAKSADMSTQKSTRGVPKAPAHNSSTVTCNTTAPSTPAKGAGGFSLQFGSISPGFMNGMQIPARTSSAPPNLDEQKREQARYDSLRAASTLQTPTIPKQQLPIKNAGTVDQSNSVDAHLVSKAKIDEQVSTGSPTTQTQKPSTQPISGMPMQVPFHQPQLPVQFGGPNPQLQSQGMVNTSLPMPMPMPLPMGNPSQVQQQVFVQGLQPHLMQAQGIMRQGQTMNFSSQMVTQLPQLVNMGISITPQFPQQHPGKFGGPRKAVKITHPKTREELRLDKRVDTYTDSGSSGPRLHPSVPPQSQPIPSFPTGHPINFYPNSYNLSSHFFPGPSSLPLPSTQLTPSSQAQRFYNQVSQGPPTVSFMNPSSVNSFSVNKTGAPLHGSAESSNSEHAHDLHNVISSAPSASMQVTVKPAANLRGEKGAESSVPLSSPAVEKGSLKISRPFVEISSLHAQRDSENISESSLQHSKSTLMPLPSKSSVRLSDSPDSLTTNSLSSSPPSLVEHPTSVASSTTEGTRREVFNRSDSNKDEQKKPGKIGHSLLQSQVGQQSTSDSTSLCGVIVETVETTKFPPLLGTVGPIHETTSEPLATIDIVAPAEADSKTDSTVMVRTYESPKTVLIDSDNISADIFLENEKPKPENVGTKEGGEIMSPELSIEDDNRIEITPKDISLKSSASVDQTKKNSFLDVTITSSEAGSLETTQHELEEEPVISCRDGEGTGELATSTSAAMYSLITRTFTVNLGHDDKSSASDTSRSRVDALGGTDAPITESGMVDQISPVVSIPSHFGAISTCEIEATSSNSSNSLCSSPGLKDKPLFETHRSKNTIYKGKKKRKEALLKADRAGTTSDLYMAYKGPEEKKETVAPAESIDSTSSIISEQILADSSQEDVPNESKAEPDDWEDAAEMTPKLENSDDGKQVEGGPKHHSEDGNSMAKKYSRDFLLKFSEQCADLPEGFEITSDIVEALIFSTGNVPRESYPSPGRNIDRPMGGPRLDRRVSGMGDDDKWNKVPGPLAPGRDLRLDINYGGNVVGFRPGQGGNYGVLRNPRVQSPVQYAGGILCGPMQSMGPQGGMQRINSDSDRWQRATGFQRSLIPSPQTPLQVMHKAERKYEVGKITDEEQAKQRQLKGILNKLTPQNFDKLIEQVKQVNIDNSGTLTGVISQIFDKALMEPTFCEMYANFCYQLAGDLPDFNEDNVKITFKRLLLNKCQEEFERGEREQEEANRAEEEDEVKQSEEEREEKRIQARRRMLGNIRLIGELYKQKMLVEKIMHSCINKLLGQYQNPDEEDVEALCKLMSTIGEMIDHPKAKDQMDEYFDEMAKLSNNMKLSSRVRFMLKDSIDLRKNKWQQRRKVEGPKKIEEVHRDAANERQANRLARGPSMGPSYRRVQQPMDFTPRGSNILSSPNAQMGGFRGLPQQPRGYGTQDVRSDERHPLENRTLSVPLPQRSLGDDSITLGPQGGLARGMSIRGQPLMSNIPFVDMHNPDPRRITTGMNGYNSVSERPAYASREEHVPRFVTDRFVSAAAHDQMNSLERNMSYGSRDARNPDRIFDRSRPNTPPTQSREPTSVENDPFEKVLAEDHLRDLSMEAIKEFYSAKVENEVVLWVKELNAPSFYPSMICIWVTDSFERKDMERDLLAKLLINLAKPEDSMLSQDHLVKGFESVLTGLEDAVNDAPKAAEFLGGIFAKVILENVIPLAEIGRLIYEGGEEQGRLVEIGLAAEVLGSVLEIIKTEKGDPILNEICTGSNLRLENFRPPNSKMSWRLDKFI